MYCRWFFKMWDVLESNQRPHACQSGECFFIPFPFIIYIPENNAYNFIIFLFISIFVCEVV